MSKKELRKELQETQEKLNIANNTICTQIEEIYKLTDMYENQLKIQDSEIKRLNTIINYHEMKVLSK